MKRLTLAGTPKYPDLKTYCECEKVGLEKYDTFLILCANRFTNNDLLLANKVKSIGKSFFFVRTRIDLDIYNQRKKKNEEATLSDIREDCLDNLKDFGADDQTVFLISNSETEKWDFDRLTQAILDVLPLRQKESLTLSLNLLTSRSMDLLKRKVEILRGNYIVII